MAVSRKTAETKNRGTEVITKAEYEVLRAHKFDDDTYTFNLKLNGITLYDLRLALNKKDEYFISMPSKKGKDGKYYKNFYFALDENIADDIMSIVIEEANK